MGVLVAIYLVVALVVPLPLMWLWNWLMPDIFGLTTIGYWQSLGLMLLSTILFYRGSSSSK